MAKGVPPPAKVLINMASTQKEIAAHLDMSDRNLREVLKKLNLDHRLSSLDDIRVQYIRHLRQQASGHGDADGNSLTHERIQTERIDQQLKILTLKEKLGEFVPADQVSSEFEKMVTSAREELLSRDDKLKAELDAAYSVEVDILILNEHTNAALTKLGSYDPDAEGYTA
jgi:transcriptional antiterminator